jgi:hypothetical protein
MDKNFTPEPITVSVTVLSQMFLYLASLKVDIDAFLVSLGIDPPSVKSPDTRIPVETYLLIQDQAADYIHDPYFGLHMGEFFEAGSWSILGYMMMNCKNLAEAAEKSGRYSRIIGNLIEGKAQCASINSKPSTLPRRMRRKCPGTASRRRSPATYI